MAIFYNDYAPAENGTDAIQSPNINPVYETENGWPTGQTAQPASVLEQAAVKGPHRTDQDFFDEYSFTAKNHLDEQARHLKVVYMRSKPPLNNGTQLYKRIFDVVFAATVMLIGFPFFVALYVITKFSSPGPAFYKQERVGRNRRRFFIYKFRSMHINAEHAGPQLSRADDPRITKWGRLIRRTRMDELPQFWNVLRGDMSIVGPRPERQHFIDQIMERRPDYAHLQMLRPGITSRGQVYYGYAENVDQMCERMTHDLHYLNNISLKSDVKVILETVKVVFQAKGK